MEFFLMLGVAILFIVFVNWLSQWVNREIIADDVTSAKLDKIDRELKQKGL